MEIEISGLKCDYCDYRDDEVKFSEYKNSIDKPCPKCGMSLLTIKEYNSCLRYYKVIKLGNQIHNVVKWFNPLYYWRLIFGDKREQVTGTIHYPNRFKNKK